MFPTEESWQERSYQDLMTEAVRSELTHGGLASHGADAAVVLARLESLVLTCSLIRRPDDAEFSKFFRRLCTPAQMHPATVEAFLRAAWKACEDEAAGVRPIPGKAEIETAARDFRRSRILDTEESWAYEGLSVQFRADLAPGEDPAAAAWSNPKL